MGAKHSKKSHEQLAPQDELNKLKMQLYTAKMRNSKIILSVDYSDSNVAQGGRTFNCQNLHKIDPTIPVSNPYQRVIDAIGTSIEDLDVNRNIPFYGFGDSSTRDKTTFSFLPSEQPTNGIAHCLQLYSQVTQSIVLSNPLSYSPIIIKAIGIVKATNQHHILFIITPGIITDLTRTNNAIVEASKVSLSIVFVAIGDGPFDQLETLKSHSLKGQKFKNVEVVNFEDVIKLPPEQQDPTFGILVLKSIKTQFNYMKKHKLV
ncbi:copine, putative [Entamoeba invadens IP1]|uniref:copine, putative n=1 Tax=Entamoeba invadens IP1 TaxID=370355 RepID=UPI0002C3D2D7|nr:copine, putative [Entamoeba invadens IP1]ELP93267.1 copine, putative [Entamoeba invadens IP1]|eukprot:XP_004260038.1 copine, putative [Entamoeba invadens IP1]